MFLWEGKLLALTTTMMKMTTMTTRWSCRGNGSANETIAGGARAIGAGGARHSHVSLKC